MIVAKMRATTETMTTRVTPMTTTGTTIRERRLDVVNRHPG
jgi:hypothetical protein